MIGAGTAMPSLRLPCPHPGQRAVLSSPARFKWLSAGRRWRKTTLLVQVAVEALLHGKRLIWGAPTYDQCRIGWDEVRYALNGVGILNYSRLEAWLPSGGTLRFRSLD